jgi:hypothetical protein
VNGRGGFVESYRGSAESALTWSQAQYVTHRVFLILDMLLASSLFLLALQSLVPTTNNHLLLRPLPLGSLPWRHIELRLGLPYKGTMC